MATSPIGAQETAVDIIAQQFRMAQRVITEEQSRWVARQLINKLAAHDPPILLAFPDELKEE